jgi:hypothetical protein
MSPRRFVAVNAVVIGLVQDFHFRYTFAFDVMLIAAALLSAWSFVRPAPDGRER